MREKFRLGIMISAFVALAALICAGVLLSSSSELNEPKIEKWGSAIFLTDSDIRNPEYALQQGIAGYLEITLPPDSPSLLSDTGGEVNVNILLHFVSYTPEVTEAQVNIDPNSQFGFGENDLFWDETVSYNLSGNISIKAGETIPVTMSICLVVNFQRSIAAIPLYPAGITANVTTIDDDFRSWVPIINDLGWKETAFY
jgi:hypothetical protein